jgi:hypothetical protein
VNPDLRLLRLRTRRVFLWLVLGLPFFVPTGLFMAVLFVDHRTPGPLKGTELVDAFTFIAVVAVLFAVLTVANLTAFLVHDERRDGRARVLRLATVDGRRPVTAHLGHASLLAPAGVGLGLVVPAAYGLAAGLPPRLILLVAVAAGAFSTVSGMVGLWIGYLLPRVAAIIALQLTGIWATLRFGSALGDAVQGGRLPLASLAWVLAAHALTLVVLSSLWRRTSARLW